jgi:DNA-binding transcriptional MerR regulator
VKAKRRTIGRLARETGVGVETVRYYERLGILQRPPLETGGRSYGDEALWRLRYVKVAQGWGWRLSQITGLLAKAEESPNFCAAVRETAKQRVTEIDATILLLTAQRVRLLDFVSACETKSDHDRCPVFRRLAGFEKASTAII